MSTRPATVMDALDVRRAHRATGSLRVFNDAGVLHAADVHVASRLCEIAGEDDDRVRLAAAIAVRGPRLGHVCVDLATIRDTAAVDAEHGDDLSELPWPEPWEWLTHLGRSSLVAGPEPAPGRPLRLDGTLLYLDRYWCEEEAVAADLRALTAAPVPATDPGALADGLDRLFGEDRGGRQALAAASAVLSRFSVVAGGPGTGKTVTVARIVALLFEQAIERGRPAPLIALAAPTGKAAARLQEAVHEEAKALAVAPEVRERMLALTASTLHRLLGWRPDSRSRFRHDRRHRLAHDVVIVDETSMVSLTLMARLVEAVRADARLCLVGDPDQLTSIEAGAVLGDVVGPAREALRMGPAALARLGEVTGRLVEATDGGPIGDGIVVLDRVHRFAGGIARVAEAIRRGDADGVVAALSSSARDVDWLDADPADPAASFLLAPLRDGVVATARAVTEAARAGEALAALDAMREFRLLCAHRRGPYGVDAWTERIRAWLAEGIDDYAAEGQWHAGRPLLVTENDYGLRLYNGDTGVIVTAGGARVAAFERGGAIAEVRPSRLGTVETVHAMTIHKSQGSQFATAAVLLPDASSPLLTRELLYTAVTRSRRRLVLAGTEESVRAAVARPVARASGLRRRLWTS